MATIESTGKHPTAPWLISLPMVAVIAGLALAYAPLLIEHAGNLWAKPQYQYAPFVLVVVGTLVWVRWNDRFHPSRHGKRLQAEFICGIGAWICLAVGVLFQSPLLALISIIILAAGVLVHLSRYCRIANLWGIWCLLWLLFPIPFGYGGQLVFSLQLTSSRISSDLLDLIGVNHLMEGNVLQLATGRLFVDEACSGIVSVMAVLASAAMFSVWKNRSLVHTLCLLVCGVGWSIVMNVGRICVIAIAQERWGMELSSGWRHEALGLAGFVMVFIAVVSTDQILHVVLHPIVAVGLWRADAERNPLVSMWNHFLAWCNPAINANVESSSGRNAKTPKISRQSMTFMGTAFAVLGLCQLVLFPIWAAMPTQSVAMALDVDRPLLPDRFGNWVLADFETDERSTSSSYGEHSRTFRYRHDPSGAVMSVSIDFPFSYPWHELCGCYQGSGWEITERRVVSPDGSTDQSADSEWSFVDANMEKRPGESGYLAFSFFDEFGEPVTPPKALSLSYFIQERFARRAAFQSRSIFQVQAFVRAAGPLPDELELDARHALFEFREVFRRHVCGTLGTEG